MRIGAMSGKTLDQIKAEIKAALKARLTRGNLPNAIEEPSDGFGEIFDRFNDVPADIFMEAFKEHLNELNKRG